MSAISPHAFEEPPRMSASFYYDGSEGLKYRESLKYCSRCKLHATNKIHVKPVPIKCDRCGITYDGHQGMLHRFVYPSNYEGDHVFGY